MASSWKPNASDDAPDIRTGPYWVTHPQLPPEDARGGRLNNTNAFLENVKGERVWLWINDITSDFAMSGTTAQSRNRREFFAHNFTQPSLNINCQTPNSYEYNRLGAFIRDAQLKGLSHQGQVLKFRVAPGGYSANKNNVGSYTVKGKHEGLYVDGYILNAGRGAERWVNAPDYQFSFVISHAHNFLGLHDQDVQSMKLRTILNLVNDPRLKWDWENGKPPKGGNGKKQQDGGDNDPAPPPDPYDNWAATDDDPSTPPNWQ